MPIELRPSPVTVDRTAPLGTSASVPTRPNVHTSDPDGFSTMSVAAPSAASVARAQHLGPEIALCSGVILSSVGDLVSKPGVEHNASLIEQGDVLVRASHANERATNIFANPAIQLEQKAALLDSLAGAFRRANADLPAATGFQTKEQALQMRASAAPLILDLAKSLDSSDAAPGALREKAIACHLDLLATEKHPVNREFMIYDLERNRALLPANVLSILDGLLDELGQRRPPYDEWFRDGKNTLRVDYHLGAGFFDDEVATYERDGFLVVSRDGTQAVLEKTFDVDGARTKVEVVMRESLPDLFRQMRDPNTHVIVYSGHSNYGRNVTNVVQSGAPQVGAKVFLGLHCGGGKGVHNAIRCRYPNLQVVQSKNSSVDYEDRDTFLNVMEGLARREDWQQISERNRNHNSRNYYFPTDTLYRKKAEDLDNDGITDLWDRVVSYNSFAPKAEVRDQMTPRDPGRACAELEGRAFMGAVQRFLRLACANVWADEARDQGVLADGFYDGEASDPIFRSTDLGDDRIRLELNRHYAHASEEVLGPILHYELGAACARKEELSESDAKMCGIMMAAKCLSVDDGCLEREIWQQFLEFERLPRSIAFDDVVAALKTDTDWTAGSQKSMAVLKETFARKNIALS